MPEIKLTELNESELAYLQFQTVLQNIWNNPFVTQDSVKRRQGLLSLVVPEEGIDYIPNQYVDPLSDKLITADPYFPIPFVYGTVARGQATESSDVDYVIIHETDTFRDRFRKFPQIRSRFLATSRDSIPLLQTIIEGTYPPLEAIVFCPAVGEFYGDQYNPYIADAVYKLRNRVIKAINRPGKEVAPSSEYIWEQMRQRLEQLLLPNPKDRNKINTIWPDGLVTKDRVQSLLVYRQKVKDNNPQFNVDNFFNYFDKLRFPDWQTMKQAFGVE